MEENLAGRGRYSMLTALSPALLRPLSLAVKLKAATAFPRTHNNFARTDTSTKNLFDLDIKLPNVAK